MRRFFGSKETIPPAPPKPREPQTIAVRAGVDSDASQRSVIPPLYLSTNFSFPSFGERPAYDYTRSGNPTRATLGKAIAQLEGGYDAVITSSGMAAVDLALSLLAPRDVVVAPHDCYGGTYRLLESRAGKGQFHVDFANLTDTDKLHEAFRLKPKLVLVETPSNPLLRLTDIRAVAALAKEAGTLLAVDNTFLSPVLQKPIDLGADIIIHSTTKYINGHSDVVGGALVSKDARLHTLFNDWANTTGTTGAPFDSYQTLRGLRTLDLRVRQQSDSAQKVAEFLAAHPRVGKVHYPGLKDHPDHTLASRQQAGYGGMLSFEVKGGVTYAESFANNLKLFSFAESLGGFESLAVHPATMTHASMNEKAREKAGITDSLIRLSIGLEHPDDLIADLGNALAAKPFVHEPYGHMKFTM